MTSTRSSGWRTHDQPQSETLEGNYAVEEVNEFVSVMKKLLAVRDIVLNVNMQYIESAAQADEYRTEPSFKLQGSYRDMNKIAEQIAPVMNDEELQVLIRSHYENQAQTLTTGAQANLLKLQEIMKTLEGDDLERWDAIKRTFKRNLLFGAAGKDDQLGQVIAQMSSFSDGLAEIRSTLSKGVLQLIESNEMPEGSETLQTVTMREVAHATAELAKFNENLNEIKSVIETGFTSQSESDGKKSTQRIQVVNKIPDAFLEVMRNQFRVLQTWMEPILEIAEKNPNAAGLVTAAKATEANYEETIDKVVETVETTKKRKPRKSSKKKKN